MIRKQICARKNEVSNLKRKLAPRRELWIVKGRNLYVVSFSFPLVMQILYCVAFIVACDSLDDLTFGNEIAASIWQELFYSIPDLL